MASPSRNEPGELSPSPSVHDLHEQQDVQWWQTEQGMAATGGKFPGFVSRPGNEHFEKLYADSAARVSKIETLRREAKREKLEREQNLSKPAKRVSKEELSDACNRMYSEAQKRRQRMARKKEEQEYLEDLQEALKVGSRSHSTPNLVKDGDPRWNKLYASGAEKERKLERERQRQTETEKKYLEDHSVHSRMPAPTSNAFNRLYNDGVQRGLRQEQAKLLDAEKVQHELEQVSVHRYTVAASSEAADEAAERLYLEGKVRAKRQDAQRKRHEEKEREALQKKAPAEHIAKRVNLLYKDAERRALDRQWMQEEFEKEHLEGLMRHSVHASVRQNAETETERIFDRIPYQDRPRDVQLAKPSRSARTPPKQRPEPGQGRPATARQASAPSRSVTPQPRARSVTPQPITKSPRNPQASTKSPRNAGGLVGGAAGPSDDDLKAIRRGSSRQGPAPFAQMPKPPDPTVSKANAKARSAAAVPKARADARRNSGPFIMTHLIEQGARQALSSDLPSP